MSFKNNVIFLKFAILYFLILIFGYWKIDLNSEEIYISFTFFVLVAILFMSFRRTILVFFVESVNSFYNRFLFDILLRVGILELYIVSLTELESFLKNLLTTVYLVKLVLERNIQFSRAYRAMLQYKLSSLSMWCALGSFFITKKVLLNKYISSISLNLDTKKVFSLAMKNLY